MSTTRRPAPLDFSLFLCIPLLFTAIAVEVFLSIHSFAGDFHKEFWPAGRHVLDGQTPYLLGHAQVANGLAFPYPALTGVLLAPLALLGRTAGGAVFTVVCLAALFATLRVLEVRDWRLYGLVLLWAPVVNAWQSANLTLILALGLALAWRYRDRPLVAGACAAIVVSLKPFTWPIGLWLLATRRFAAVSWAFAAGLAVNLIAWSVIGLGQIGRYLHDASLVSAQFFRHAYTPVALSLHLGLGETAADAVGIVCGVIATVACVRLGRRGRELAALTVAVALMWLASPVLWMHYFALLIVPLAIARPRLHVLWAAPIALFACGSRSTEAWQIVFTLGVVGLLVASSLRSPEPACGAGSVDGAHPEPSPNLAHAAPRLGAAT